MTDFNNMLKQAQEMQTKMMDAQKKIEEIERFEKAVSNGDYDLAAVIVGEAIDFVNDQPSADEIVNRTIAEAIAVLRRPSNFSVST